MEQKVTLTPILIGALGTVLKGLAQGLEDLELRGRVEIFQTRAWLKSSRILRGIQDT